MAPERPAPAFPASVIGQLARVLGRTEGGLTGSEIDQCLAQVRMANPTAGATKWVRIHDAFVARHNADGHGGRLINFINLAMEPARYINKPGDFDRLQAELNEVLTFVGLRVNEKGQVARGTASSTLSEAAEHAHRLRGELRRRGTHEVVLDYCTTEILERNAFHASLEATKSVADRLRMMTGVTGDGSPLVDATLAKGQRPVPRVQINAGLSESEVSEQNGLAALCKGLFSMFRNPVAHDPRISRVVSDDELLDVLTVASLIHRRIDDAMVNP